MGCPRIVREIDVRAVQEGLAVPNFRVAKLEAELVELQVAHGRSPRRNEPRCMQVVQEAWQTRLGRFRLGAALATSFEDEGF